MSDLFSFKRILVITAHPDDEAFLAAGTIRQLVDAGAVVVLACATYGERGQAWTNVPAVELGRVRARELRSAAALMGVAHVEQLGFSDGTLATQVATLTQHLQPLLGRVMPEAVLTFGPDGYTGHADHCALHAAVLNLTKHMRVPTVFFAQPPDPWGKEIRGVLSRKRIHGVYHTDASASEPTIVVSVDRMYKELVLRAHETQFPGLDPHRLFSPACAEHFLTHEYFTLAD